MPKATSKTKTPKKPHIYLLSDVNVAQDDGNADTPRQFSGVANSGKPFSHFGTPVIVDLADIQYHDKVPALIGHDRDKRAGFGVLSVENNQLIIKGTLLNNEFGNEVADDADAGFPWQMSAHVMASSEETLSNGETATVNGQTVTAPITILRKCKIPEVSFTPTGVDSETSAVVLGDTGENHLPTLQDTTMTLEELQKAIAEEKALTAKLTAENADLKKQLEDLQKQYDELKETENKAQVDAQLSQAGFTKSEDGKFNGLSDGTYNMLLSATADNAKAMIGDLKLSQGTQTPASTAAKPALPNVLLGEQYLAGQTQGVQLSDNPLVANAQARSQQQKSYI